MRSSYILIMAAVLFSVAASWSTIASDILVSTAIAQPVIHPSDDTSYSDDVQADGTRMGIKPFDNGIVQYISGGVSDDDMPVIKAEENNYNLKMLFAAGGEYLANIRVDIKDARNMDVLNATIDGPVLLVRMPPGRYNVIAKTEDGTTLTRAVQVSARHLSSYVVRYPMRE